MSLSSGCLFCNLVICYVKQSTTRDRERRRAHGHIDGRRHDYDCSTNRERRRGRVEKNAFECSGKNDLSGRLVPLSKHGEYEPNFVPEYTQPLSPYLPSLVEGPWLTAPTGTGWPEFLSQNYMTYLCNEAEYPNHEQHQQPVQLGRNDKGCMGHENSRERKYDTNCAGYAKVGCSRYCSYDHTLRRERNQIMQWVCTFPNCPDSCVCKLNINIVETL